MENNENKKKNNFKKLLVTFIIILVIILAIIIPVSLLSKDKPGNNKNKLKGPKDVKTYECTKKGQICSFQEMYKGVEVNVEVAKDKTYTFSMIANDKNTMTLMLQQNIEKDVEWDEEGSNQKGPQTALYKLNELIKDWENIPSIKKYSYTDRGKIDSERICSSIGERDEYQCPKQPTDKRGYNGLTIEDGNIKFLFNLPQIDDPEPGFETLTEGTILTTAKARLITIEEYEEFITDDGIAKWLLEGLDKNEGYWTMTSAHKLTTGYNYAAIAIVNKDGKIRTENVPVARGNEYYKVGIRPVIKIDKK